MTLTNSGVSVSGTFAVIGSSTTLGSSGADLVTINGDIGGDLNPRDSVGAGQYDIGGSLAADHWRHAYFDGTITMDAMAADDGADIQVKHDIKFDFGKYVDLNESQSGVGSAGAATALPSQPTGYIVFKQAGTKFVIPYYAQS